MSDLSPESAPRRTFADHSGFMVHVLTIDDALALYETAGIPRSFIVDALYDLLQPLPDRLHSRES